MKWRNAIWDVDGTLFDTYPSFTNAFHAALRDLGIHEDPADLYRLAKVSVGHCIATLSERHALTEDQIRQPYSRHYEATRAADQPPFPGLQPVLQAILDAGGQNAIVTHRRRAGLVELLAEHDMAGYFCGSVTGDDGFARKPDPASFAAALQQFGLDPAETLNVGDREIDILGGQAAGMAGCLFAPDGVDETKAELVIASYGQLLDVLLS